MTSPSLRRLEHQLASLADLPVVSTVVPLVEAPFAHRHHRGGLSSWRPSVRQLAVVLLVIGVGVIMRRRRRAAAADRHAAVPASNGRTAPAATPQEDRSGTWADDGGAAPGRPGDDPTRLSTSPTGPSLRHGSR